MLVRIASTSVIAEVRNFQWIIAFEPSEHVRHDTCALSQRSAGRAKPTNGGDAKGG